MHKTLGICGWFTLTTEDGMILWQNLTPFSRLIIRLCGYQPDPFASDSFHYIGQIYAIYCIPTYHQHITNISYQVNFCFTAGFIKCCQCSNLKHPLWDLNKLGFKIKWSQMAAWVHFIQRRSKYKGVSSAGVTRVSTDFQTNKRSDAVSSS